MFGNFVNNVNIERNDIFGIPYQQSKNGTVLSIYPSVSLALNCISWTVVPR